MRKVFFHLTFVVYGICLSHSHYQYRLQLPYKGHRTYLTNHMGSMLHHIATLVINSLGADTHTCKHTHIQTLWTEAILRNQAHAWFKNLKWVIHENICNSKILLAHYAVNISSCKISTNTVYKPILCTYVCVCCSYLVIT